ncbi:MAG: hypothetical protein GXP32_04905 [Kiritimatiellaeota bacterium]|nr:hypothetical protein [Kiritimatiellota bacterium]
MPEFAFIFLLMFFSVFAETLCGAWGWLIPFTALSVFQLSIVYGWRIGMLAGIVAGAVLDSIYGRSAMTSPFAMIAVSISSVIWLRKGDTSSILPNFLPGALAGFVSAAPPLLLNSWWRGTFFINIDVLFLATFSGALIFPIMIAFLDFISEKTGLRLYRKAKAAAQRGGL